MRCNLLCYKAVELLTKGAYLQFDTDQTEAKGQVNNQSKMKVCSKNFYCVKEKLYYRIRILCVINSGALGLI